MKVDVYSVFWNEEQLLPYFLRHYAHYARKIILYDNESTDASRAIAQAHPLVEVRSLGTNGEYREDALQLAKRHAWRDERDKPDWIISCDIDEFLVHPNLVPYLEYCRNRGVSVPISSGWQMISDHFPSTNGQIYEEVTQGFFSSFLSKNCLFDPNLINDIGYGTGCHFYEPTGRVYEHFSGDLRLLHCKYLGPDYVVSRNELQMRRLGDYNKQRALCTHLKPEQETRTQFAQFRERAIPLPPLPDPRKLHVGCSFNRLPGWENHDIDLDISKPLPFEDGSLSFIFGEHVFEHINPHACVRFLKESFRCLRPGGVLRLCVPCIENIIQRADREYMEFTSKFGVPATLPGVIDAIIDKHGHESIWTTQLLLLLPAVYGFTCTLSEPRKSTYPDLQDIDGHWKALGEHNNWVETSVVECQKPFN